MARAPRAGDWLTLLTLTALWGSAFMFNSLALEALPPPILVAGRILLGTMVLVAVLWIRRVKLPTTLKGWMPLLFMAVFANVLPFQFVAWAQQYIESSLAGVLMAIMPLFVLTLAHYHLPGERLTPARITGFCVGFLGVMLVLSPKLEAGLSGNMALWGALATLAAAFSYSFSTVYARRLGASDPLQLSAGMLIVASVLAMPGAAFAIPDIQVPGTSAVIALLFLGFLSTGIATLLYFRIIQGPGPAFLSLVNYMVPAWAVFAGAIFLDETLAPVTFVGLTLILGGIALSEFGPGRVARLRDYLQRANNALPHPAREES